MNSTPSPCAVSRANSSQRELMRSEPGYLSAGARVISKSDDIEIPPILERPVMRQAVVEPAQNPEGAGPLDGKILVGGRRRKYGKPVNALEAEIPAESRRHLPRRVV